GAFDLLPDDVGRPYSRADDRTAQEHVDAMFEIAFEIGTALASDADSLQALAAVPGCADANALFTDDACLSSFVDAYGAKVFRRPLTTEERATFVDGVHSDGLSAQSDRVTALVVRLLAHPR